MNGHFTHYRRIVFSCGMIILFCVITLSWYIPMWPFQPVYFVRQANGTKRLLSTSVVLGSKDAKDICLMLENYNETFIRIGDVILVRGGLFFDKNLRWNYTSKAGLGLRDRKFSSIENEDGAPSLWIEKDFEHERGSQ